MAAVVLAGAPLLWSACSDSWDDHYSVVEGGMADQPTLLENIAADQDLANFYKVINGIGAVDLLSSPQQLTVWAPKGLTSAQADSVIAVYQADVAKGRKWEDNKAVIQFLQNHIALYARPVSSLTNDTVSMLNKKYMSLVGTSATTGSLNSNPFNETVLCNNGILYKVENVQTFFPNVREYLEQTTGMDSIVALIESWDKYDLDESSSVPGGVEDGKMVYIDSVMTLSNTLLRAYGYIQREDSTYMFIAPTNELWTKEYDRYKNFYQYDNSVPQAQRDSLTNLYANLDIIQGRFFNTSMRNRYNRHPEDSLVNTSYTERQSHNPRRNVYYKPFEGILNGLQRVECSNGSVYVDNKGVIAPQTTFLGRYDMPAYFSNYYEIPKNSNNVETMRVRQDQYNIYDTDSTFNIVKSYYYAEVTSVNSTGQTSIEYTLPSTLSNVYYNIYVVTVPDSYYGLPCWFQVRHVEKNASGNFPATQNRYENPHPITADSDVANADLLAQQSNSPYYYVASAEKVDTILVQAAVKYDYAGAGLDNGTVKLIVQSIGDLGQSEYREKIYTRTLRLNEIILVPFETKEEALAAADDKDAFNDELLEANKEN